MAAKLCKEREDLAWAAGLFDGEGAIIRHKPTSNGYQLTLGMTDEDVVRRFHTIVGTGKVHCRTLESGKGFWQWYCGAATEIVPLLEAMLPFFGIRRTSKAQEALPLLRAIIEKRKPSPHGTVARYSNCKCDKCKTAKREYDRAWRKRKVM